MDNSDNSIKSNTLASVNPDSINQYAKAKELLKLGFPMIPSGGGNTKKHPLIEWTAYESKLPSEQQLAYWNRKFNPKIWGYPTGPLSGIVVFDADSPETIKLMDDAGLKAHVITKRGKHYYFPYLGAKFDNLIHTMTGIIPHVDIRAKGGFVNCLGENENACYEMLAIPTKENLNDYKKLPKPIIEAIGALQANINSGNPKEPIGDKISSGNRNHSLARIGGALRRLGMSQEQIEANLLNTNKTMCDPPLPDSEVKKIAKSISRYKPGQSKENRDDGHKPSFDWHTKLQTHTELIQKDLPPIKFLIDQILAIPGLGVIGGKKKTGKSYLVLDLAVAVAQGGQFLGLNTIKVRVVYFALEDGERRIRQRLLQKKAPNDLDIIYFYEWPPLNTDLGRKQFIDMIKELHPRLAIIDTLASSKNKLIDENDNNQMADFINWIHKVCIDYDLSILIVAHHGKKSTGEPGFDIRGASATSGATDVNMGLYKKDGFSDLVIEGRDIPSLELSIQWNNFIWQVKGNALDLRRQEAEDKILEAILTLRKCTVQQIAGFINMSRSNVQTHVERMRDISHKIAFETIVVKNVPHHYYYIPDITDTQTPKQPKHTDRLPVNDNTQQPKQVKNEAKTGGICRGVGAVSDFPDLASNNSSDDDGYLEALQMDDSEGN